MMMGILMFAAAANAPVMLAARDEAQWRLFVRTSCSGRRRPRSEAEAASGNRFERSATTAGLAHGRPWGFSLGRCAWHKLGDAEKTKSTAWKLVPDTDFPLRHLHGPPVWAGTLLAIGSFAGGPAR